MKKLMGIGCLVLVGLVLLLSACGEDKTMLILKEQGERSDFIFAAQLGINACQEGTYYGCETTTCVAAKLYDSAIVSSPIFFDDYTAAHPVK